MRRIQGGHRGIAAGLLQAAIDIVGPHLEALHIVGFAAEPGDGEVERGPRQREGGEEQPDRGSQAGFHTTPHFRRSSHSEPRMAMASRKIAGISQRSRVSRVVIPASEYEISFVSLDASSGL